MSCKSTANSVTSGKFVHYLHGALAPSQPLPVDHASFACPLIHSRWELCSYFRLLDHFVTYGRFSASI
jgi:hypothetical protein